MNVEATNQRLVAAFEVAADRWALPFQQDRILNEDAFDELYGLATALCYTSKQQPGIRPELVKRLSSLLAILSREFLHHPGPESELKQMQAKVEACMTRLKNEKFDFETGSAGEKLNLEEIMSGYYHASERWGQCVYVNLAADPAAFQDLLAFAIAFTFIFKDEPLVPKNLIAGLFDEADLCRQCAMYDPHNKFELERYALKIEGCAWMILRGFVAAGVQWQQPRMD